MMGGELWDVTRGILQRLHLVQYCAQYCLLFHHLQWHECHAPNTARRAQPSDEPRTQNENDTDHGPSKARRVEIGSARYSSPVGHGQSG